MLNLRPSSTKEKLFKLQSIKGLIDKTNSEERCKQLLYLAERVTQHNMGLFHFRRLGHFSKDYHAIDFEEAKKRFTKYPNINQEYHSYNGTKITFANFSKIYRENGKATIPSLFHQ
ncbi:hypothetical protein ACGP04_07150 [Piscirickettsia salmonis]|uniref:hypothetical protein n=1 Tax=Piscirickettsia salmonis TaxID=1238 RepID=UPI00267EEEA1